MQNSMVSILSKSISVLANVKYTGSYTYGKKLFWQYFKNNLGIHMDK